MHLLGPNQAQFNVNVGLVERFGADLHFRLQLTYDLIQLKEPLDQITLKNCHSERGASGTPEGLGLWDRDSVLC